MTQQTQPSRKIPHFKSREEEVQLTKKPRILVRASRVMAMVMPLGIEQKISLSQQELWANYTPQRAKRVLQQSTKTFEGVDKAQLLTDIAGQREQATRYHLH